MGDPDHDSMFNIVEYQLGWDPAVRNGLVLNVNTGFYYPDIHLAIRFATHGDTLIVYPGMYAGNINFNGKAITVRSLDPTDATTVADTIISYGQTGVAFQNSEQSGSVLDGFTITGCEKGIYCSGSSPTIRNCEIRSNSNEGLYCISSSSPSVTDCIISNNISHGLYCTWYRKLSRLSLEFTRSGTVS